MPEAIWDIVDAHAAADPASGDRSSYIFRLVSADLDAAGKMPGSVGAQAMAKARAIIAADPQAAESIFTRALQEMACSAANNGGHAP